jgi:hypothetical protein
VLTEYCVLGMATAVFCATGSAVSCRPQVLALPLSRAVEVVERGGCNRAAREWVNGGGTFGWGWGAQKYLHPSNM